MMRNCEVVENTDLADAICGKFANTHCSKCDIAICERHRETCKLCGAAFCPSCLPLHKAQARHSARTGHKKPRRKTA